MIVVNNPQGILPRYNPRLIENNQAQVALNCVLERGDCRPLKAPVQEESLAATTKTVFHLDGWKEFNNYASVIASPVSAGSNRYYWTNATGGGYKTEDGTGSLPLGVPHPTTGPTLTKGGTSSGESPLRSSVYLYTRVTAWGEESAPSRPSGVVDVYEGEYIKFSGMSDGGDSHVTHYRLYRAIGGTSSSVYTLVPYQIGANNLQYDSDNNLIYDIPKGSLGSMEDGLRDVDLTISIDVMDWLEPPSDLKHLTDLGNGTMMGSSGKEVCFSALWVPYAWPMAYRYTLDYDVVGVGHISGIPIAFTEHSVYIFDGSFPDSYHQRKLSTTQGCVNAGSIFSTLQGVFFASRDGLCLASQNNVEVLTLPIWTREQWNAMDIEDMTGVFFNGRYYGFFKGKDTGVIGSMNEYEQFVTEFKLDGNIVNVYIDVNNEELYILLDKEGVVALYKWDSGDNMESAWKSKIFREPSANYSAFKLVGEAGEESEVVFYVDGEESFSVTASHNIPLRLPAGFKGEEFEVEIASEHTWYRWGMGRNMEKLRNV